MVMVLRARPKVLIMTASAGGGHVAAAKALEAGFKQVYGSTYAVEVCDVFTDPRLKLLLPIDRLAVPAYSNSVKIFRSYPYKLFFNFSNATPGIMNRFFSSVFRDRVRDFLQDVDPDVIISTYPIISYATGRILDEGWPKPVPIISLVTDSGDVHRLWLGGADDAILVSTRDTIQFAVKNGVARDKLYFLGFPVDAAYNNLPSKQAARQKLGLNTDKLTFVLSGGGLGLSANLYQLAKLLSQKKLDGQFIFVAGQNTDLYQRLQDLDYASPTKVFGYVDTMPELVAAADVMVGKAGWITLNEAMIAAKPTIIIDIIKGQEESNAAFVERHGIGIICQKPSLAYRAIVNLIKEPQQVKVYQRRLRKLRLEPEASLTIPRFVVERFIEEYPKAVYHQLTIHGRRVNYAVLNPKAKQTIVMIHGMRGNNRGLLKLAQQFSGYRVIIPDLPGYGASETLSVAHSLDNYANFLEAFCAALHLHAFDLVGHSFGAGVCLVAASKRPASLKTLTLITPVSVSEHWLSKLATAYYQIAQYLPPHVRRRWLASKGINRLESYFLLKGSNPDQKKQIIRARLSDLNELNAQVVLESAENIHYSRYFEQAGLINVPTLIIGGGQDQIAPPESTDWLAETIAGSQLINFPQGGHLLPLEEPELVGTQILVFIKAPTAVAGATAEHLVTTSEGVLTQPS
ncbi:MAG TPA: alpha/beta fold hydrolase [Candidatus Saccharimonadia bacterium]